LERQRLTKVILYGTLATTEPFYNISTLCKEIKNKKQMCNFSQSSKRRMQSLEEPLATHEPQFGHP